MAQLLLTIGGIIFILLGTVHGVLTLRDISKPRAFTPTDDAVRIAMQGARLALNSRINLWQAWLGFNLSHSLGLALFGSVLLLVAWRHFPAFADSPLWQAAAAIVAGTYLVLSMRFWF